MSREQGSLLWHHYDLMTGMDWIICKILWILHLSRKTEAKNTIVLAGIYETTAWEIHFWGYGCICVSVYERERGTTQVLWEGRPYVLWDSQRHLEWKLIYQAPWHLRPPVSTMDTWSPWLPQGSPDQFYPVPKHPTAISVLKTQPSSTIYHMCDFSKALAVCTSVSSYVSWANQTTCCVGLLQD